MTTAIIRSQGVHGAGSRTYAPEQYRRVVAVIRGLEDGERATVEEVSQRTGIAGRTVREIVSAADGVEFLLGGDGDGYRRAMTAADARRLTLRFASQATRMAERTARRDDLARELFGKD